MRKFSNISRYKLQEALYIVGFFVIVFILILLIRNVSDFPLLRGTIGAVLLGLITAWYEIVLAPKLQSKITTFLFMLATLFFYYIIFSLMLMLYAYINLIFKAGLTFAEAMENRFIDIYPQGTHEMLFYFFVFILILQLTRELRMKTGRGLTKNFLLGKLRNPLPDKRIFMFMDLTSSTSFAEKLGHQKYSSFIRDIYLELDEHIIASKGSLYQYVGDEVVVSWSVKDGIKNNNCIKLFFSVEKRMRELENYFKTKYDAVPKFKAGLHIGEVAITEVGGVLKRELAFHGDVVNTTARICAECRTANKSLLASKDLVDLFNIEDDNLCIESIGRFNLRGKKNAIELLSIVPEKEYAGFYESDNKKFERNENGNLAYKVK